MPQYEHGSGETIVMNPGSDADLRVMTEILVKMRAPYQRGRNRRQEESFIEWILCKIAEPVKPPAYRDLMQSVRVRFDGIAEDRNLQEEFRKVVRRPLLEATTHDGILDLGVPELFDIFD